jgi:hypothetical protein
LRYNRTTGLMITQMQELVRRVNEALASAIQRWLVVERSGGCLLL